MMSCGSDTILATEKRLLTYYVNSLINKPIYFLIRYQSSLLLVVIGRFFLCLIV